ncbi:hypothetical protein ERJ75_001386200 [Trypanosoma vivax]|nr:hypothetical protein ERJ75_001386200 [Trypanosoma vivax]
MQSPRANSRSVASPVLRGGLLPSESDSDKRHRAGPTHACTSAGAKPFSPYGRLPKSTHVPSRATCLARGGLPERPRHSLSVSVLESVATARGRTQEQGRVKAQRETRAGKSDALCRTCARVSRTWVEVTRLQPSAWRAITRRPSRVDRALPFSGGFFREREALLSTRAGTPSVDDPNSCDRVRVSTARWRRRRGARAWNAGVS